MKSCDWRPPLDWTKRTFFHFLSASFISLLLPVIFLYFSFLLWFSPIVLLRPVWTCIQFCTVQLISSGSNCKSYCIPIANRATFITRHDTEVCWCYGCLANFSKLTYWGNHIYKMSSSLLNTTLWGIVITCSSYFIDGKWKDSSVIKLVSSVCTYWFYSQFNMAG